MKTETIITNEDERTMPYPKLMMSKKGSSIIFFYEDKKGVVVSGDDRYDVGEHSEYWDMNCFIDLPLNQQVILQND
jgi:hypothetical protein